MKIPLISSKAFWFVAILMHVICFLQAIHSGSIYLVDSIDYLSQAQNLKTYSSLYAAPWNGPFKFDYFTFRPPIYGIFILVCKSFFDSDYSVLIFQSIISLITFIGVKKLAKQLFFSTEMVNFFLLLVLFFYPSQLIHCNFIMSDILFQSLLFWSFYFSYNLLVQPNLKAAIWSTIFFTLAMLTKPVAFLLGFSILLVLIVVFYKQKKIKLLLPFILLPITYHSYCTYNKNVTGYYHYSSVAPIFVLKYMAKYTNAQLYGEAFADSVQDEIMLRVNAQQQYQNRYNLMNKEGVKIIQQHALFFTLFNVKGWAAFMLDPGRFEWVHFLKIDEGNYLGLYHVINTQGFFKGILSFLQTAPLGMLFILLLAFLWNTVSTILLLLFLIHKKVPWQFKLFVFLFIAYIVVSTGVLGLSRYRVAVAPLIWIAGIYVIHLKTLKQLYQVKHDSN